MKVALVALGPTATGYLEITKNFGSRDCYDQVWVVNKFAGILKADLIFHMDDLRLQELRAQAGNVGIAHMLESLRKSDCPVITSRSYPAEYPASQAYPLQRVVDEFGYPYFNSTVAYAVPYAFIKGVKELHMFGCDYAWLNTPQKAERGRGCVEYWIGRVMAKGMSVRVLEFSNLLDGGKPQFYGYDSQTITLRQGASGKLVVSFEDKSLPTAEEIEKRYDHTDFSNLKGVA